MASIFKSPDTTYQKKAEVRLEKQEEDLRTQELRQLKELAARRRLAARGSKSRTLFDQVLGTTESVKKYTIGD